MEYKNIRISIAWVAYQRRAESLAKYFDLDMYYIHYKWEEKSKYYKPVSYIFKLAETFKILFNTKAKIIFVQIAPTLPLYPIVLYCKLKKAIFIADCHNTTFYDSVWIKLPLAKKLLYKANTVFVHNEDILEKVKNWNLPVFLLRDPIPEIKVNNTIENIANIEIKKQQYVIIPGSFASDEPMKELFNAMKLLPDVLFACTWFAERMPKEQQKNIPLNLHLTGFLNEEDFNAFYANAAAAIVLTTREGTQPSGASEAIALNIPLVISDIATTRRLYKDAPVFVNSDGPSIANGVRIALNNVTDLKRKLKELKEKLSTENNNQLAAFKEKMKALEKNLKS
jgi:glycosyltransferase involved in cell wall biosynthesis